MPPLSPLSPQDVIFYPLWDPLDAPLTPCNPMCPPGDPLEVPLDPLAPLCVPLNPWDFLDNPRNVPLLGVAGFAILAMFETENREGQI